MARGRGRHDAVCGGRRGVLGKRGTRNGASDHHAGCRPLRPHDLATAMSMWRRDRSPSARISDRSVSRVAWSSSSLARRSQSVVLTTQGWQEWHNSLMPVSVMGLLLGRTGGIGRQPEGKHRTTSDFALDIETPTMEVRDLPGDRQANPGAAGVSRPDFVGAPQALGLRRRRLRARDVRVRRARETDVANEPTSPATSPRPQRASPAGTIAARTRPGSAASAPRCALRPCAGTLG